MSNQDEWLDNLKVGDQVAVMGRAKKFNLSTVERLTKTQIILNNGSKYRKSDGWGIGGDSVWYKGYLQPVTPQMLETSEKNRVISKIKTFSFENMTLDKLQRIWNIIKED